MADKNCPVCGGTGNAPYGNDATVICSCVNVVKFPSSEGERAAMRWKAAKKCRR